MCSAIHFFFSVKELSSLIHLHAEVCVTERLTTRTPDLEFWGSSLACLFFLIRQENLLHFVSLHPGVKMGNGDILQGGVAILLGMLHATETGVSSGRMGLWLLCGFTLLYIS